MNENDPIDWAVARQTVQYDEDLLRELISTFLDEIPGMLQTIRSALDRGDAKVVQRIAHTLKGALGHFGAQRAYQTAYEVETRGRDGDLTGAATALPPLEEAMAQLTPFLLDYVDQGGRS
jgi:HPt (histidine-containing phosphotransfer) domain-containing protein